MNSFEDLVMRIVKVLNDSKIVYMFTGALAASFYGVPRTTVDIDIIICLNQKEAGFLATQLKNAGLQISERKIEVALRSDFKIVTLRDEKSPFTLDIILSDEKLERKKGKILGIPTYYQTPEALILSKLRMIKVTISEEKVVKDKEDVKAILKYAKIDLKMLKKKAAKEGTLSILDALIKSA